MLPLTSGEALAPTSAASLKALGISGWPVIVYTRVSHGTSTPETPAELFVESSISRDVTIPGLISCNTDADCPEGQTCLGDFQCG